MQKTRAKAATPEKIILEGVPVPGLAYLEVRGANLASFRVFSHVPPFLGGDQGPAETVLIPFRRTAETRRGIPIFVPL